MDKKVECKYRITATVKADTIYELEAIKERLIRAGAKIPSHRPHYDRHRRASRPAKACSLISKARGAYL